MKKFQKKGFFNNSEPKSEDVFMKDIEKMDTYKKRPIDVVFKHLSSMSKINVEKTIKSIMIARAIRDKKPGVIGFGLRHETTMRLLWLAVYKPSSFMDVLKKVVELGSYRDVFSLLEEDIKTDWESLMKSLKGFFNPKFTIKTGNIKCCLPWNDIMYYVKDSLEGENRDLVIKYLPQIKSKSNQTTVHSQATTIVAWTIANYILKDKLDAYYDELSEKELPESLMKKKISIMTNKLYRELKTSGEAHEWQKQLSKGEKIDDTNASNHAKEKYLGYEKTEKKEKKMKIEDILNQDYLIGISIN